MAKIVLAGKADCPHFSRVELLADYLAGCNQEFRVHKIVKTPQEWPQWLKSVCQDRGWLHNRSPIVWREILDRGGKGMLIGGAEEFQEYAFGYYGVKSAMSSDSMLRIASENLQTKSIVDEEEAERLGKIQPIHVAIVNASNDLCYHLLPGIADGEAFGPDAELAFHLYEGDEEKQDVVRGICMELHDLSYPLVRKICAESRYDEAFANSRLIIILDDSRQDESESKEDYCRSLHAKYSDYANAIASHAAEDVRVLVAGRGPVNFIAMCLVELLPQLPRENIVAMSRGIERHAKGVIGEKLKINAATVADVIVWGNPSESYLLDVSQSRLYEYNSAIWGPGYMQPTTDMVHDDKWLATDFVQSVRKRHTTIKEKIVHEVAVSDGLAISSLVKHWVRGAPKDRIFSLGVMSTGAYDIPEGIVYSVPVRFPGNGQWNIVTDINVSEANKETLLDIAEELLDERDAVYENPGRVKRRVKLAPVDTEQPATDSDIGTQSDDQGASVTLKTVGEVTAVAREAGEEETELALQRIEEDEAGELMAQKGEDEDEESDPASQPA